jgi:hypothetical protein
MAQTSVRVRTVADACVAVGWTGHRTLTVDRPEQAGGMRLGFSSSYFRQFFCLDNGFIRTFRAQQY